MMDQPDSPNSKGVFSSASFFAITPADGVNLPHHTRAIFVGAGGALVVLGTDDALNGGSTVTFTVQAGQILPINVSQVYNSGTTASGLIGLR